MNSKMDGQVPPPGNYINDLNLPNAWMAWVEMLMKTNRRPGAKPLDRVGQVGIINVNTVNSADPETEKKIAAEIS